jgi:flavin reductase (DIM6/NTAB) family NADH-FMN oxidoreductase RutF
MASQGDVRGVFGQFASGVTIVTCFDDDGHPHGATMTAFTAVSLEPRLCQVTVNRTATSATLLPARPFAINILASDQSDLALEFAGRPNGADVGWVDGIEAPALVGAITTLWCRPWADYDGGDHLIVIGEIVAAEVGDGSPLLYHRGNFHLLGHRTADAHWGGSFDDPTAGWFSAATAPVRITDLIP